MKYSNRNREHEHVYNVMILNYYSHYFIISCSRHTVHITLICRLNFIICAEDMYAYIKYVNIGIGMHDFRFPSEILYYFCW